MLQILSTGSVVQGCVHSDRITTALERGGACKRARYGEEVRSVEVRTNGSLEVTQKPHTFEDDEQRTLRDPLDALGLDVFQSHILTLLDSRSLARCSAVSSRWRRLSLADKLWQPLVESFFAQRAHLPLCLMGRDDLGLRQHVLFAIAMTESQQQSLLPAEMCGRTWELRVKPACGPYWLSFDPTQVGKRGFNRYFSCDGSISSDPGDPIWGGHACVWEFLHLRGQEGGFRQLVQVNRWPPLFPRRMDDGRWVLENLYGLYITRPDNPAFSAGRSISGATAAERGRLCCNSCTPPTYGFKI